MHIPTVLRVCRVPHHLRVRLTGTGAPAGYHSGSVCHSDTRLADSDPGPANVAQAQVNLKLSAAH
eukprot:1966646-Rhodomonas_salina.2